MAALGFHIVLTLIVICVLTKSLSRISIVKAFIIRGLYRFVAPSNHELRALLPTKKDEKPRQRKKRREEEDNEGFNVPRQLPLTLRVAPVDEAEIMNFAFYTNICWLSLFTPLAVFVYSASEIWKFYFPANTDTNVSIFWLILGVIFVMQTLTKLTAFYWCSEDERGLLLSFGALYFLGSIVVVLWADRLLDIDLLAAYDHFNERIAAVIRETGTHNTEDFKPRSPLLLYISSAMFFSFLSTMLVFPNFRCASMYSRAQQIAPPVTKIFLHFSFLLPALTLMLFLKPVKFYLVEGPRPYLTASQVDILRVFVPIVSLILRLILRKPSLQSHLDMSYDKVQELQRQTGHIRNISLQTMIYRYYSYFCAAVVQYFSPELLAFFFALLLKSTAEFSWLGNPQSQETLSADDINGSPQLALRVIFDAVICRAFWSFALLATVAINFTLSLVGVIYNTYTIS